MQDKLLPLKNCPFCNTKPADIFEWYSAEDEGYATGCNNEKCLINITVNAPTKKVVAKAWNTRAEDSIKQVLVDNIKEAIEFYGDVIEFEDTTDGFRQVARYKLRQIEAALALAGGENV